MSQYSPEQIARIPTSGGQSGTTSAGNTSSTSADNTYEVMAAKALGKALSSNKAVDPTTIAYLLQGLLPTSLVTPAAVRAMPPSMWDMYVGFLTQATGGTIRPEDVQWQIARARPASPGSVW